MGEWNPTPSLENPFGLTKKQSTALDIMVEGMKRGKGLRPNDAHELAYDSKYPMGTKKRRRSAWAVSSSNFKSGKFRKALVARLVDSGILGYEGKVSKRLMEGLDARKSKRDGESQADFKTRLDYIKEINKITGVYAPERKETRQMTLNVDASSEELDRRIQKLSKELKDKT